MHTIAVILLGSLVTIFILAGSWYLFQAIACWRLFAKAGEPGWKAWIPLYNTYIQYKISWNTSMFWTAAACMLIGSCLYYTTDNLLSTAGGILTMAGVIINIIRWYKLSLAFGHGIPYALGLLFLNPVFILMLGFGGDGYRGPQ